MFRTLEVYPADVSFFSQNQNEKVFILVRSHIFINAGWIFRTALFAALPIITYAVLEYLGTVLPEFVPQFKQLRDLLPAGYWLVLTLIYYSSLLTYAYFNFLHWFYNIYLVTSERFLHIEYKILSGKKIAEAPLRNIQDISQHIVGFFPSLFNYGDVSIQTASERGRFHFRSVPDPSWFRDVISDLAKIADSGGGFAGEP